MDPKKLQSVQNLAVTTLIILLVFSGGFLWGEFKKVSKLDLDDSTLNAVLIDGGPIYTTGNTEVGKKLFQSKCQRCHLLDRKMTGPALMNIKTRWSDSTHLYAWIKNSQSFLATGDKYANDLFRQYNSIMPAFPELTEEEIREILYYVDPE